MQDHACAEEVSLRPSMAFDQIYGNGVFHNMFCISQAVPAHSGSTFQVAFVASEYLPGPGVRAQAVLTGSAKTVEMKSNGFPEFSMFIPIISRPRVIT